MLDLALALQERGLVAEIVCPDRGILAARARGAGVAVFAIEKHGGFDHAAILRLRDHIKSAGLDIVHAHNGRTALIATLAVLLAGRGRTVLTQHFLEPARVSRSGWRGWLARLIHRWILTRAEHVVAISDAVRRRMLERREVQPSKATTVWNGINDPAAAVQRSPHEIRETFGIAMGAPLIVSAARLEPEKAVDVLIAAMAVVRRQFPQARCLVAGEGRLRHELQEKVNSSGLKGTVELIGFQSDVLALVHAADVFILPSPAEPFGLALVEAMALARPVVAARAGGPVEIVIDEISGLLVHPGDSAAMAQAIVRILDNPALAQRLGEAARQRFVDAFTAGRMGLEMAAVYRRTDNSDHEEVSVVGRTPTDLTSSSPIRNHGFRT